MTLVPVAMEITTTEQHYMVVRTLVAMPAVVMAMVAHRVTKTYCNKTVCPDTGCHDYITLESPLHTRISVHHISIPPFTLHYIRVCSPTFTFTPWRGD